MKRLAFPILAVLVLVTFAVVKFWPRAPVAPGPAARLSAEAAAPPGVIRLSGSVEAIRSRTVIVPRLAGQMVPTIVITKIVAAGSHVQEGDVIVEFDRQEQQRIARDRRAELVDLDGQIEKKKSEQAIARAVDQTALDEAERNVGRAELDVRTNELVSQVAAEKNSLMLEQAKARFNQLKQTFDLKRKAADADLRILEIRRARSQMALEYAEKNATLMSVAAPFSGLVVLKQMYKGNGRQSPVAEGEEVRAGLPILDIIDASQMQVRAKVNQADVTLIAPGQPARVRLDAYPQLLFDGRVETVTPLGVSSEVSAKVRNFTAVVSIHGSDPLLMPDLTASVEISTDATSTTASTASGKPRPTGGG